MDLAKLCDVFPEEDLEWRVQTSGVRDGEAWAVVVPYVTARAVMDRLDTAVGPENWQNRFESGPDGGIICGLGIKIDGEWVWKWDGAENTDIESVKGGLSSAEKRAAVQWGIGRYLYRIEIGFATITPKGKHRGRDKKSGVNYRWDPPTLPEWARPN